MTNFDINISSLFEIAFGIKGFVRYQASVGEEPSRTDAARFDGIPVISDPVEASRMSFMGTPVIFPIKFRGGNYNFIDSEGNVVDFQMDDFELPAATIVDFRRPKVMTTSRAVASEGTTKEMYGFDDWQIEIRGIALRDPSRTSDVTAYEQHLRLLEWESVADAISVSGDLFIDKNISHIVIREADFRTVQGKPGMMPFSFKCVSDKPAELFF